MYLGIDFVRAFNLGNDLFSDRSLSIRKESLNEMDCDDNTHQINLNEQKKLDEAINSFLSYSKSGLGRTSLVTHVIDTGEHKPIRQRHFAISPAIEMLLFEEIDRMLSLGVIEECGSGA